MLARWLAEDEEFRQRFERESQAAERVTHPHVLPIWDYGEENGLLYLATPLCDLDLGDLISEHEQLDADRALRIIGQVAWALDWAHGRGVVHRDVKPENVLLIAGPDTDHAYLADFGLARAKVDRTLTMTGHPAGLTPAYAAPEQWMGEEVGPAADQYALAATLYTCLSGHPPFHPRRGPSLRDAHLKESPPQLDGVVGGLPAGVGEAVARGLAKDPDDRFPTCRDLITAAQAAASAGRAADQGSGPPPSPTGRVPGARACALRSSTQVVRAAVRPAAPAPRGARARSAAQPAAPARRASGRAPPARRPRPPGRAPPAPKRRRVRPRARRGRGRRRGGRRGGRRCSWAPAATPGRGPATAAAAAARRRRGGGGAGRPADGAHRQRPARADQRRGRRLGRQPGGRDADPHPAAHGSGPRRRRPGRRPSPSASRSTAPRLGDRRRRLAGRDRRPQRQAAAPG